MSENVLSPVEGVVVDLSEVPDAAFSSGALGPGFAVEPLTNLIGAPISGEIVSIAPTGHAVTIRSERGLEVLVHLGIDTVAMEGRGIEARVKLGQTVVPGETILQFEYDEVAAAAKSLCTPVVIINAERFEVSDLQSKGFQSRGDAILTVHPLAAEDSAQETANDATSGRGVFVSVAHEHGLHARPASVITKAARAYNGRLEIRYREKRANAKSLSSILALGLSQGDRVTLWVDSDSGEAILMDVAKLIGPINESGATDKAMAPDLDVADKQSAEAEIPSGSKIRGAGLGDGLASGAVLLHKPIEVAIPEYGSSPDVEWSKLQQALSGALGTISEEISKASQNDYRTLLEAYAELLVDPSLQSLAFGELEGGISAGHAWQNAVKTQSDALLETGSQYLLERQADFVEISKRVLIALYGGDELMLHEDLSGRIVVASDLTPSEFFAYQKKGIAGIALAKGGISSHVSILCQSSGVCSIIALGNDILNISDGRSVMLEAKTGILHVEPDVSDFHQLQMAYSKLSEVRLRAEKRVLEPVRLTDGAEIEVFVNIASVEEAKYASEMGARGCGLLRTEFLFHERALPPSVDEQIDIYKAITFQLSGLPIVVRALDAGADKPVPFFNQPTESNPALGERGLRLLLKNEDTFRDQLRAVLSLAQTSPMSLMLPMVNTPVEVMTVRGLVQLEMKSLGLDQAPEIGVMIETPASVFNASDLARVSDFFSIGTNDLTQYVLAMDRTHPSFARVSDGLSPSVLRAMLAVGEAAQFSDTPVSVCGGLASDPLAVPILIACGVRRLSAAISDAALISEVVRQLSLETCRNILGEALTKETAEEVREVVVAGAPALAIWR